MNRVTHFEIAATDPEKSAIFYREVFGWNVATWPGAEEYWTLTTGPQSDEGIDGGMFRAKSPEQPRVSVSVLVDSIDAHIAKVVEHGGKIVVPKRAVHGVGCLAYFLDCDGAMFCLHEPEPESR